MEQSVLTADLPRGHSKNHIGEVGAAHFAPHRKILEKTALRFDPTGNPQDKLFLGVLGGKICEGAGQ